MMVNIIFEYQCYRAYFDHHLLTVFHRPKSTVHVYVLTSVKLAAYPHSAADSPKKVKVQKHPQQKLESASNFCGEKL